ncbi:MAG: sulfotransferase domain-containing protein [Halioglobus sp.]|nr:sulfotransferase domain-containing protein [Halioglobus sp.]
MAAMRKTQGVSIPRSGHAIAFQLSTRYFGDELVYCDSMGARFCGCRQVPCVNPARNFAKHHDFGLRKSTGSPVLKDEAYLIQYRNPVHCICSNYQLYLKKHPHELSEKGWRKFACREAYYWNHFIDKWVLDFPANARPPLYVTYEELLGDPLLKAREILAFMSSGNIDEERFDTVMSKIKIESRGSLSAFQYPDHGFFDEIEQMTAQRLAGLSLPRWNDT